MLPICSKRNIFGYAMMFFYNIMVVVIFLSKRYTVQSTSMEDRKAWLEVMEGKEPVYSSLKVLEGLL